MNVTSLELSKELYEVSRWGKYEHFEYWWDLRGGITSPVHMYNYDPPAYDLGYLLRKLPNYVKLFRNDKGKYYCAAVTGGYRHPANQLGQPDTAHEWYVADTPEDAAAKLAIELFKQGALTRGSDE